MASAADVPAPAVESEDDDEEPAIISSATAIQYISSLRNFLSTIEAGNQHFDDLNRLEETIFRYKINLTKQKKIDDYFR